MSSCVRLQAEGEDNLKKVQLMELAILNGTYRDANVKMRKDDIIKYMWRRVVGERKGPGTGVLCISEQCLCLPSQIVFLSSPLFPCPLCVCALTRGRARLHCGLYYFVSRSRRRLPSRHPPGAPDHHGPDARPASDSA